MPVVHPVRAAWIICLRAQIPFLVLVLLACAGIRPGWAQPAARRVQPPAAADCPREHLTLYAGTVQSYRPGAGSTELSIRTDWGTTERIRIVHPGQGGPAPWFLLHRQPFQASDWPRIEARPGVLRPGLSVAAWVCDDGRNPLLDWQPPTLP